MNPENFDNIVYSSDKKDLEELFDGVKPSLSKEEAHRLEQIDGVMKDLDVQIKETEKELTEENIKENERLLKLKKELEEEKRNILK